MKTTVICGYSQENRDLAELTRLSRLRFCEANKYCLLEFFRPHKDYLVEDLCAVKSTLYCGRSDDQVLLVDADVLFTATTQLPEVSTAAGLTMSREIEGRSPINAGISLWSGYEGYGNAYELLLIAPFWNNSEVIYWQHYISRNERWLSKINILPPRVLNPTDQSGEWRWQKGDLICHFLGGTVESKIERIKHFIAHEL